MEAGATHSLAWMAESSQRTGLFAEKSVDIWNYSIGQQCRLGKPDDDSIDLDTMDIYYYGIFNTLWSVQLLEH